MRLVFDPRVGLKSFISSLKNRFCPTRGSNTSRITNSLSLFYLLNHSLNFHNWRLICVSQPTRVTHKIESKLETRSLLLFGQRDVLMNIYILT